MSAVPGQRGDAESRSRNGTPFLWLFPCAGFCLALFIGMTGARDVVDASWYRLLALGENSHVLQPFSARVLAPFIAGSYSRIFGGSVDRGFLLLGLLSLLVLLVLVFEILARGGVLGGRKGAALCAAVFLMPFWVGLFHGYYLPDLISAAILVLILWCLTRNRITLAMLLLFPAYLARESTLLVALCLLFAAWRRVSLRAAASGVAATVCGLAASAHFEALGAPSREGVHGAAYLVGKVIWNFPRNTIGLALWTNRMPLCKNPAWTMAPPHWLHLGAIQQVGFCGFSSWGPERLLLSWFGVFGVGPALVLAFAPRLFSKAGMDGSYLSGPATRGSGGAIHNGDHKGTVIAYRFSVVYGAISFLLAPALGASTERLVAYGWPIFLIALPWFFQGFFKGFFQSQLYPTRNGWWILAMHLACCWTAWFAFHGPILANHEFAMAIAAVLSLNVAAFILVVHRRASAPVAASASAG